LINAALDVWALAQIRGVEHCSLVTPEKVLSEYNKNLIYDLIDLLNVNCPKLILAKGNFKTVVS